MKPQVESLKWLISGKKLSAHQRADASVELKKLLKYTEELEQRLEAGQHETIDTSKLNRLTVVEKTAGRVIEKWDIQIKLHVQDEGRTLKIFYE